MSGIEILGAISTVVGIATQTVTIARSVAKICEQYAEADENFNVLREEVTLTERGVDVCQTILDDEQETFKEHGHFSCNLTWYSDIEHCVAACHKSLEATSTFLAAYTTQELKKRQKAAFITWKVEQFNGSKDLLKSRRTNLAYYLQIYNLLREQEARKQAKRIETL